MRESNQSLMSLLSAFIVVNYGNVEYKLPISSLK